MQTVVELPEFERRARHLLSETEKQSVISYLAAHPRSGVIMQGTGGIRKFRWASGSKGKSGGVRIVYYYHNETVPVFLLSVFGKSEQANLSKAERNELAKIMRILVKNYGDTDV
ncbi:MAG: type II toxin-antitoxin system RelE/ParE family toxin [Gammaproteobacteria bacterium]|nr:type II toxin-antitoxin system RelE/ParE family toxin [Gammaproteobacteria bacterium]